MVRLCRLSFPRDLVRSPAITPCAISKPASPLSGKILYRLGKAPPTKEKHDDVSFACHLSALVMWPENPEDQLAVRPSLWGKFSLVGNHGVCLFFFFFLIHIYIPVPLSHMRLVYSIISPTHTTPKPQTRYPSPLQYQPGHPTSNQPSEHKPHQNPNLGL